MRMLMLTLFASLLFAQAPSTSAPPGNAQNGRKLFENYGCYQCHGREAQGGLGTGPRLGPKPIAFAQVQRYIRQPTGQMPPYTAKVVSDQDLADIYAFLQSVKQPPPVKEIPLLNNSSQGQ
jgi:ubiquinol-cytochrome c reductase cytochrome c subunit